MYAFVKNGNVTQVGELVVLSAGLFVQPTGDAYDAWAYEHGVFPIVEGEQKDQRFYWVTFDQHTFDVDKVLRTYTNTAKALEDVSETPEGATEPVVTKGLKSQWIAQVKAIAGSMLAPTDWMVIRKAERSVDIPETVATARAAIVAECTRLETAITAAADVEALIAVVQAQNWTA
jgi:hypothetical protein